MAEQPNAERSQDATPRRIERARQEGQVAVGRDSVLVAGTACCIIALITVFPGLVQALVDVVSVATRVDVAEHPGALLGTLGRPLFLTLAVMAAGAFAAGAATLLQTGGGLWPNLAAPDLERVFQGGRLKRLFNGEVVTDTFMAILKVAAVGGAAWVSLSDDFMTLPRLVHTAGKAQTGALFSPLADAAVNVLAILAVLAGLDLAVSRHRYKRKLMMTTEEVKREQKEEDGDPLFRNRRKQRHRDLVRGRVALEVPRADVLVVNPTHVAVALRYRAGQDGAPRVTAKGKGVSAERMRELARSHAIPIYRDISLARQLYRRVRVGREVPADTYKAVAAVLAFVYRVAGRRAAG